MSILVYGASCHFQKYFNQSIQINHISVLVGWIRMGLLCLTRFSTIFQLYHGCQFHWWRKSEYPGKTDRPVASH